MGYLEEGHFAANSMLPKVEAAAAFAKQGNEKTAIITSIDKAFESLKGNAGTKIR